MSPTEVLGLLRLASPALPIGGFSYSQGLETAIELGWVHDEASLADWLRDLLTLNIGCFEAPLVHAICRALAGGDVDTARRLNDRFLASRETAELRAETLQMGRSLTALLDSLDAPADRPGQGGGRVHGGTGRDGGRPAVRPADPPETTLPLAWARAARHLGIDADAALAAYVWAWAENQVMAAIKAIPIGQLAGQRTLARLTPAIAEALRRAPVLEPAAWSNFAPGFALASSRHETQYSRIFRS